MIPSFNASGVLPPFVGTSPAQPQQQSPYSADMVTVVSRFGTTPERASILRGLIDYRAALAALQITEGFQWIDGSFVENCETLRGRPPADVDMVTFAKRPLNFQDDHLFAQFVSVNLDLFDPVLTKARFKCDAYFVDLHKSSELIVDDTVYWQNLFSHQRSSALWKGMIKIPLQSNDALAGAMI